MGDADPIKSKTTMSIDVFPHEINGILTCQTKAIQNFFVDNVWSSSIFTVHRKQYFDATARCATGECNI